MSAGSFMSWPVAMAAMATFSTESSRRPTLPAYWGSQRMSIEVPGSTSVVS